MKNVNATRKAPYQVYYEFKAINFIVVARVVGKLTIQNLLRSMIKFMHQP
jgi:hypothetical protein